MGGQSSRWRQGPLVGLGVWGGRRALSLDSQASPGPVLLSRKRRNWGSMYNVRVWGSSVADEKRPVHVFVLSTDADGLQFSRRRAVGWPHHNIPQHGLDHQLASSASLFFFGSEDAARHPGPHAFPLDQPSPGNSHLPAGLDMPVSGLLEVRSPRLLNPVSHSRR